MVFDQKVKETNVLNEVEGQIIRRVCMQIDDNWEIIIDFTKIKKGGVPLEDLLSRF